MSTGFVELRRYAIPTQTQANNKAFLFSALKQESPARLNRKVIHNGYSALNIIKNGQKLLLVLHSDHIKVLSERHDNSHNQWKTDSLSFPSKPTRPA